MRQVDRPGFERAALHLIEARTVEEVAEVVRTRGPRAAGVLSMELVVDAAIPVSTPPFETLPLSVDGLDAALVVEHRVDRAPRRLALAVALVSRVLRQIMEMERSQRMITHLQQLEQVSGVDLMRMDLDSLLDVLPQRITSAIGSEFTRIFLLDDDMVLVEASSHGIPDPSPARSIDQGLTGRVMQAGTGLILDTIDDVDVVGVLPPSVATVAGVPLILDGKIIGVLDVGASADRRFDHEDLTLLELAADRVVTAIDRTRAFATERDRRLRSDVLAMLGLILQRDDPIEEVAARVARMSVQRICDVCRVTITGADGAGTTVMASQRNDEPIVLHTDAEDTSPQASGSVVRVPLTGPSMSLGHIVFERRHGTFTAEERRLHDEVATRVATTLELRVVNERLRQTAIELQRSLLPGRLPDLPAVEVAVAAWAAAERVDVGGDFYDVMELGDDRWGVLVGDISGKGIRAAAMTGIARHTARAASRHGLAPAEVLRWIHDAFLTDMETSNTYCTAVFGLLERRGHELEFTYAVGGHPLPIVAPVDGPARHVGSGGTVLGLVESIRLRESSVVLAPGDTLVLYTDGVTDVPGDGAITEDDLLHLIDRLRVTSPSAEGLVTALEAHLVELYRGRRLDDTVVLAVRNLATAPSSGRH